METTKCPRRGFAKPPPIREHVQAVRILFPLLLLTAACPAEIHRPWSKDVIYFAMTDRFSDGDPENNIPQGSDPALYDANQKDIARYMGGDLRGVETALESGYFNDLGVTAIWLTPVVRNVWRSGYDLGGWKTGYHGYWTQDWLDIDEHLVSKKSLKGKTYPPGAEGRMEHYRDLVKLAHDKGIKIIQDVVLNHAGPVFYYDTNHNDVFDVQHKDEWVQPFKPDGFHDTAKWTSLPRWNAEKPGPDGPRTLLGQEVPTTGILAQLGTYGRKGFSPDSLGKNDGEEVTCDFFSLRDIWTAGDSEHFDELVNEFVAIYHFYLHTVGVDGLRIDTVKHVHREFWDAFTTRLREKLGSEASEKILFGEIYDGNPATLGRYTWNSGATTGKESVCLDGVLDFNTCFSAREYLRQPGAKYGSSGALEKALAARYADGPDGKPFFNPNKGADGLNARDKIITFIENHDGLNRFRAEGISARRNLLAQGLVLTLPGIPCLYYGTEGGLPDPDGHIGEDGETGRLMLFRRKGGPSISQMKSALSFQAISRLTRLRAESPELTGGAFLPLWADSPAGPEDDGVFVFARVLENGAFSLVAINPGDAPKHTFAGKLALSLPASLSPAGRTLVPVHALGAALSDLGPAVKADSPLRLTLPPASLVIYRASASATR